MTRAPRDASRVRGSQLRAAVCLVAALAAASTLAACRLPRPLFDGLVEGQQWCMGTRLRIALEPPPGAAAEPILAEAFSAARALDALLSDYRAETPLSRFSAASGGPMAPVDPRLHAFLVRVKADAEKTSGTFDVTVGALVRAYQRGPDDPRSLALARSRIGIDKLELGPPPMARLRVPGMRLDPGGIGKGMAVDAIVAVLRARGVRRAWVDFGGSSLYGLGAPLGRRGWPVLVTGLERARPIGRLFLRDLGLATSESLPPLDPLKSKRRGHIVDPRTGALMEAPRYALAVSPSATDAEVLTKALILEPSLQPLLPARFPGARLLLHAHGAPAIDGTLRGLLEAP